MRQTLGDSRSQRTEQQALIEAFPKTLYQREPNPQAEQTSVLTRGQFSSCFNFQPSSCSASKTAAEQMLAPGAENLSLSPKLVPILLIGKSPSKPLTHWKRVPRYTEAHDAETVTGILFVLQGHLNKLELSRASASLKQPDS